EIDVPDLQKELLQKMSIVEQRRQEQRLAESQLKFAQAQVEVAEANVGQRQTEVAQTNATREFRQKRLKRYQVMAKRDTLSDQLVDEEERDFRAAEAAWEG